MSINLYIIKRLLLLQINRNFYFAIIFYYIIFYFSAKKHRVVGRKSTIVIEGPQRCGNSSALRLMHLNYPNYKGKIATHLHRPFQIFIAKKFKIPYILLLRDPCESVVSHVALLIQKRQVSCVNQKDLLKLINICIIENYVYLRSIDAMQDLNIIIFDEYIENPNLIARMLSKQTNLIKQTFDSTEIELSSSTHVLPDTARSASKREILELINSENTVLARLNTCKNLYSKIVGACRDR